MRGREAQSDLISVLGDAVVQSPLVDLERSAMNVLTREIFLAFRPMLSRACTLKVLECTFTPSCDILEDLSRTHPSGKFLTIEEIPSTLFLSRWSKDARSKVRGFMEKGPFCWDSMVRCRNWLLNDLAREMCVLASEEVDDFVDTTEMLRKGIQRLREKRASSTRAREGLVQSTTLEGCVRDPEVVRHSRRRQNGAYNRQSRRRMKRCGICRRVGHNRSSCSRRMITRFRVWDSFDK
ncbi:hypothetical protein PIB30_057603 [Stylosanthes scabra]|uniref:Uncharacterized protein n=1 Tax=Stylosanthes scabra TaxID=79078 RepID=A0ABU6WHX6_9FABA|nr:hypothetical protein [Stylosanthes scabra]